MTFFENLIIKVFLSLKFLKFFCTSQFGSFHKKIGQEKNSKKCWVTQIFYLCFFYNFEFVQFFLLTAQVIITKKSQEKRSKKCIVTFFEIFFLGIFLFFFSSYFSNWVGSSNKKDRTREKEQRMLSVFFSNFWLSMCLFWIFLLVPQVFKLYGLFNQLGSRHKKKIKNQVYLSGQSGFLLYTQHE